VTSAKREARAQHGQERKCADIYPLQIEDDSSLTLAPVDSPVDKVADAIEA
jgi:hypothetical protein